MSITTSNPLLSMPIILSAEERREAEQDWEDCILPEQDWEATLAKKAVRNQALVQTQKHKHPNKKQTSISQTIKNIMNNKIKQEKLDAGQ